MGREEGDAHRAAKRKKGLAWSDPWLQAIDLEYHNIDLAAGLHHELVRQGSMRRIVSEEEIRQAIFTPPAETRAYFRGRAVARFNQQIKAIQWDEVVFSDRGRTGASGAAGAGERCASRES